MPSIAAFYEIRWRLAGSEGAWSEIRVPANQSEIKIAGVERDKSYEGEACAIAASGARSAWVPVVFTVDGIKLAPRQPQNLTALSVADGVSLKWEVDAEQPSAVVYCIERADLEAGPFTEFTRVNAQQYTMPLLDSQNRWFRVRAVNFGLVFSEYSNVVSGNATLLSGAYDAAADAQAAADAATLALIAEQQARDQAISDALIQAALDAQQKVNAAKALIDAEVDGLQAQLNDFAGQADDWAAGVDYIKGDFVKGGNKLYRAKQAVPAGTALTDSAYWEELGNYTSAGDAIVAALSMSTQNASDIAAEHTRVDTIFGRVGTAEFEIDSLQQGQADTDQALANHITQTTATFGDVSAQITQANQARADGDSANAQAIQSVQAGLAGKADASVVQSMQAYSGGENLIVNSAFTTDLAGITYTVSGGSWSGLVRNLAGPPWKPNVANTCGMVGSGSIPQGNVATIGLPAVKVSPGRYAFSVRLAAHRCINDMLVLFHDDAGNLVAPAAYGGANSGYGGGSSIDDWFLSSFVMDLPAGCTQVSLYIGTYTTGEANPYTWFCQPQIARVAAGVTVAPAYSVGGRELFAKATLMTDVAGNIAGYETANDGKRSYFRILADVFEIVSSLASSGMEWRPGYLRVYTQNTQFIIGNSFGAEGDLVLYFGPNVGAAAATKSNAKIWFDKFADAYYGGNLRVGTVNSSGVYNITTLDVGVRGTLNHAGSNGRTKTVTFGFTWGNRSTASFATLAAANSFKTSNLPNVTGTITVKLDRNGTQLGQWPITSTSYVNDPEYVDTTTPPHYVVEYGHYFQTSQTLTDAFAGTGDVPYNVSIVSTSGSFKANTQGSFTVGVVEQ